MNGIVTVVFLAALVAVTVCQETLSCTDNLSCPRTDPDSEALQCISTSQLCDGSELCSGGQDEGQNLAALDCTNDLFTCTTGETVELSVLCDGTADCSNGNDETSPICENKCRSPYKGGCAELNRECSYTELDVSCDDCLTGYSEVVGNCVQGLTLGTEKSLYSVEEDEGSLEVCIDVLLGTISSGDTYTVTYTTVDGDAEAPDDYLEQSGSVDLTSSATKQCISIPVVDDSIDESDQECFVLSLSSDSSDITVSPSTPTICINDTDESALVVGLEETAYTVDEVDSYQLVCIGVLSGDVDGREIMLSYSTTSGTASSGNDYTSASGDVTIDDDTTRQCISVAIRSDSYTESTECFTFSITLENTVANLTVDPDETSICIIDRNSIPVTVGLTQALYTVGESSGSITVCYEILSGRTATRSIYMTIQTVQGDAIEDEDYTDSSSSDGLDDNDSSDCDSIPILSDSLDEEEECFTVSLSTSSSYSGLTLNPRIGTICITDDDPTSVTIGLQKTSYSVYETDEYQVVCAEVLSGDIAGRSIDISYTTEGDTAEATSDFIALDDNMTLSEDALIQCVPIDIVSDSVAESDQECFTFSLSTPQTISGLSLSPSEAEICISDEEVEVILELVIYWEERYYSVSEADGSVEVCAELSTLQFTGTVEVNYATVPDSAEASDDFTETSGTFTFSNTDSTECVTIDIVDDSTSEPSDECFTLELLDGTETIDNPNIATVCITDDDAYSVTVGFEQTAYTVDEVDDYQLVCFKVLSGNLASRELTFDYTTTSGTATTSDYTSTTGSATITEDVLFQCVSIPIRADSSTESTYECFNFGISSSTTVDGLTVSPSQTQICIRDTGSIPITIGLTQVLYTVSESSSNVIVCYEVLSGRTATRGFSVNIRTVQGDAIEGEDYTYSYSSDSFVDTDQSDCDSIPILSDSVDEEEECFTVSLSTSSSYSGLTLNPRIGTICITDDDPTSVTIGLQKTSYSVYETDEYQVVCAEVLSGDIAGRSIDISYITEGDTAEAPDDFTALNNSFQISANATIQCVPISITSDSVEETGEECFTFSISTATTIAGLTLSPSEAEVCISDAEVVEVPDPTVRLSTGYYSVSEGDGSIEVCAQVTTDQYDNTIQADYVTTPGSASDPDDFDGVSGTFSFTSGTTESCVTISVVDDSVRESVPECFTVILGDVTGADLEDPSVATVCIEDNDVLAVTIGMAQTEYTVGEVDDYQLVCFGVLSGDIDSREIVFDYTTSSGTADTSDYSSRSGEVTISEDALIQCVSIPIRSDSITETEQCFNFGITAAESVSGLTVSPSEAEICITDTSAIPITIGLRRTLYNVSEDVGSIQVCYAVLSGRTATRSFSVQLRTVQGSAIEGEDYTYSYSSDSFGDTDQSECDTIPILSDSLDEEEECFTVSLSVSTSYSGVTLNPRIGTICINDEDPTLVEIGLERTTYTAHDNADYQIVCANVESGSVGGRNIELGYTVEDNANTETQNGVVLFTDDASIQCIAVSISSVTAGNTDDSCLTLTLSTTTSVSGLIISPSSASICVFSADDIELTIGLERGFYSTEEDGGNLEVCIEVKSGEIAGRSISIDYTTLDGSANAPSDFTSATGTLTVTEGSTSQCVTITIIDDNQDEDNTECFALAISISSSDSVSLETAQATICITDNDVSPVTIGLQRTSYTVTEDDALVLVCTEVESGSTAGRSITVNYQTANNDAVAPDDYTSTSGSFDMTDTNTVQCIPISIVSDSVTETDEECFTFTLSTTSTTAGLTLSPTSATICISGEGDTTTSDSLTIGLQQSYYSTVEGSGPVDICIAVLSGDITGNSFTISYSTSDGQAEAPGDYVAQTGSLTLSDSSECVSISIQSDSVSEPGLECLLVTFSTTDTGFTFQSPGIATICIRDAVITTPVTIGLQESQYTVTETEDYQFVCAEVRSGDTAGRDIAIDFTVEDSDNVETQNGDLLFTDDALIQCVAVSVSSVTAGTTDESCLTVTLSTSTTVTGLTISPSLATVCKVPAEDVDPDDTVTLGLQRSYYSSEEDIGSLQICVEVSSGELAGRTISLSYSTIDGIATAPVDFVESSGSLTITEDGSVECISITIVDDIEDEEEMECFAFSISTTTESVTLDISQATICISDNDATDVTIGLEETVYSVTEGDSYAFICTTVVSGSTAGRTLTIDYETADGSATAPSDYTSSSGSFDMTDSNTIQCIPISIVSDSVTETDEECFTYTLSTTSTAAGLTLSPTSATICINDPEEDAVVMENVTIGLRQSYYSTMEGQGPVEVCISALSGDFDGNTFSVSYTTISGQAEATSDYVTVSGSVEISETETSQCVSVSIASDSLVEGEECFLLSFSSSSSDFILKSPSVATICIRDALTVTPVTIGLQLTQYSAVETEDYQFVCVTVQSGDVAGRDIEISYVVEDYVNTVTQNGTLLFTDDAAIQCVAVSVSSVTAGTTDESCLTLTLSTTTTVSGLTISPSSASICLLPLDVIDGDTSVTIGLQAGFYSTSEDTGFVEVCIGAISGDISGRNISIDYMTIDGSAKAQADFVSTSGRILLTDYSSVQCVNVTINDDDEDEQEQECFVFDITVGSSMEGVTLSITEATVCITDNDATQVTIGLQQTSYEVVEEDTYVLVCSAIDSGSINGKTITIEYQTADGVATAPNDYTSTSGSFDMTDSNTVQCIPISIVSDSVTETDEECFTYTISITSTAAGLTLSPTSAAICINDPEEDEVTVGLQQSYYSTVEGQGPVEVCLGLISGDIPTGSNLDINYITVNGLAEASLDYVMESGTFTISETQTSSCLSISIVADTVEEPDMECFIVRFSSTASGLTLAPNIATICIHEGPRATLSVLPPVVLEGQTSQACVFFTRLDRLSETVNITLSTAASTSTATDGTDYVGASQEFVIDSEVAETQVCLPVLTLEDMLVEDPETVSVVATGATGISITGSPATLFIHSRESIYYQFVETVYTVQENVTSFQVTVELAPSSGELLEDLTLYVSSVGGSAMESLDYQGLDSIPLTFAAGSVAGDSLRFSVEIIDDSVVEGSEQFSISITDSTSSAQPVAGQDLLSVAIIDNDFEINAGFAMVEYTAEEGVGLLRVCLEVFGLETLSQASLVRVQTIPGTAEAASDYAPVDTVVVFPEGSTSGDMQCVNVTILDDDVIEGTEIFTLQATTVGATSLIIVDPSLSQTTVAIADSEIVNFRIVSPASVDEDIGQVEVCVEQMNGELGEEIQVTVRTTPIGTTASVSDYESAQFLLAFPAGVRGPRSQCGSISVTDDILVEEDETVTVMAAFVQSSPEISLVSNTATITITDNDYVLYSWENPEYKVVEDSESLAVQLCLVSGSGTLTFPIEISIRTIPISATEGEDFQAVNTIILMEAGFKAGTCSQLSLSIIKDGILESDETFYLSAVDLSSHAMPSSTNGATTLITITDDDSACQQELEAARSSDCSQSSSSSSSSSANTAGVGGGVVGGFVAGVLITIVLAIIILLLIGWKCVPRVKKQKMEEDIVTGIGNQTFEESSKM